MFYLLFQYKKTSKITFILQFCLVLFSTEIPYFTVYFFLILNLYYITLILVYCIFLICAVCAESTFLRASLIQVIIRSCNISTSSVDLLLLFFIVISFISFCTWYFLLLLLLLQLMHQILFTASSFLWFF